MLQNLKGKDTEMQFMLQYFYDPSAEPPQDSPEAGCEVQEWMALAKAMAEAGVAVWGAPLLPPETATTLRKTQGSFATTDGPFAEAKEILGGFDVIEVADLDAALEWARRVPGETWTVEIRPVMNLDGVG
ncbi:MAG: hypothetical protein CSA58_00235 [Micrococcales bacterium]|nr:MAG: hypothetical protein CSA58_12895 [Micrococcales bacterium]PIE28205.1 MAG: hypothetical protein CSA58_00235 [Micrococcales bacterium]